MVDNVRHAALQHQLPEIAGLDVSIDPMPHPPKRRIARGPGAVTQADNIISAVGEFPGQVPANKSASARYPDTRHRSGPFADKGIMTPWAIVDSTKHRKKQDPDCR